MDKLKLIFIFIGILLSSGFLVTFLQSGSPLDLFIITIGIMVLIFGFHIQGEKVNETPAYFGAMTCVNVFQWLILIYIFFIDRIYITADFFYYLVGTLLFTIFLIIQISRNKLNVLKNSHGYDNLILKDKIKVLLIFMGLVIMIICLTSFIYSKYPLELFGSSLGMMAIVYGCYREDNKVKISFNYFLAMLCVILFQWFILIFSNYVPEDSALAFTFTSLFTLSFFIQIRESDLKYIGKMRANKRKINYNSIMILAFASSVLVFVLALLLALSNINYFSLLLIVAMALFVLGSMILFAKTLRILNGTKDKGYLVCNKCNEYYELQSYESPEDFTDQCECGGKLEYQDSI